MTIAAYCSFRDLVQSCAILKAFLRVLNKNDHHIKLYGSPLGDLTYYSITGEANLKSTTNTEQYTNGGLKLKPNFYT